MSDCLHRQVSFFSEYLCHRRLRAALFLQLWLKRDDWVGHFAVVEPNRIRMRHLGKSSANENARILLPLHSHHAAPYRWSVIAYSETGLTIRVALRNVEA